jgi:Domain of unknown function (DUF4833)
MLGFWSRAAAQSATLTGSMRLWLPSSSRVIASWVVVCGSLATPTSARAGEPAFGANDIQTTFFIAKSDDRNRVDYGMRLDTKCTPYGEEPVFPYWREFEPPAPVRTKPMSAFSKLGYGISTQKVLKRSGVGGEHAIKLKQVDRFVYITTSRGADGRCSALVRTKIAGVDYAELTSIFVKLSGPLSVAYVDLKGKDPATGRKLEERLRR